MTVSIELRTLHYLARAGALSPTDRDRYEVQRANLFAELVRAQARGYAARRRSPRVPRALNVRLQDGERIIEGATLQLSSGGFSMYLDDVPRAAALEFTLALPGDAQLVGRARLVGCVQHGQRAFFACFALADVAEGAHTQLEQVLLDTAIENAAA